MLSIFSSFEELWPLLWSQPGHVPPCTDSSVSVFFFSTTLTHARSRYGNPVLYVDVFRDVNVYPILEKYIVSYLHINVTSYKGKIDYRYNYLDTRYLYYVYPSMAPFPQLVADVSEADLCRLLSQCQSLKIILSKRELIVYLHFNLRANTISAYCN